MPIFEPSIYQAQKYQVNVPKLREIRLFRYWHLCIYEAWRNMGTLPLVNNILLPKIVVGIFQLFSYVVC